MEKRGSTLDVLHGCLISSSVLFQILFAVRYAAARFSPAIYSYALTNCSLAGVVQRTRIARCYFARLILAASVFISPSGTKSPASAARRPFSISLIWYSLSFR